VGNSNEPTAILDWPHAARELGVPDDVILEAIPVLTRAQEGDRDALAEVEELCERLPALASALGNCSRALEAIIISEMRLDPGIKLPLRHEVRRMRRDLGYQESSELERLLIDRLLVCWLRVNEAEFMKSNVQMYDDDWFNEGPVWDRRVQVAHKSFLDAAKTLAQVRKLLYPRAAQINIGAQQVNTLEAVVQQVSGQGQQLPQTQDAEFEGDSGDEEG